MAGTTETPVMMIHPLAAAFAALESAHKKPEPEPILRLLDKDEINLGDLNPLIHYPELSRKESVDALTTVLLKKFAKYGGEIPRRMESSVVYNAATGNSGLRFIARFEVSHLTRKQMRLLEKLVKYSYPVAVRTQTDPEGVKIPIEIYPPINGAYDEKSKTAGWYMGPDLTPTEPLHAGLFVFKDLGEVNVDNFLEETAGKTKFIVEVREAGMYQTDLVQFVTQVSSILGQGKIIDQGKLLYEVYYDLIRLGIKKTYQNEIYGMNDAVDRIRRGLLIPLGSEKLAQGIKQEPESVLLIGVPGTGKTEVIKLLLQTETGLFILPINPLELLKELSNEKPKQTLLPRIAEVSRKTRRKVILHVDDIENMVLAEKDTSSTIINLMKGVQESGFHLIASTNAPEKIDPALLEPQRFGIRIYCGMQPEEARLAILKIHANAASRVERRPLFANTEVRDSTLAVLAEHTEHFTPRYLWKIVNEARSYLSGRIAERKKTTLGLKEKDIKEDTIQIEDWSRAFRDVSLRYDREAMRKRDEELRLFVEKHSGSEVGFTSNGHTPDSIVEEIRQRIKTTE